MIIRYEGPKGGPGMPEMLTPTSAIMGAGLGKDVALITDGRFSGGSHGFHRPRHARGPRSAAAGLRCKNGDKITIDADRNLIEVDVTDAEMADPQAKWKAPPLKVHTACSTST